MSSDKAQSKKQERRIVIPKNMGTLNFQQIMRRASSAAEQTSKAQDAHDEKISKFVVPMKEIARDVLAQAGCPDDDLDDLSHQMVYFRNGNLQWQEFCWVREALLADRTWNLLTIKFRHKFLKLKVIKAEKFTGKIPLENLLDLKVDGMTCVGPFFTKTEREDFEKIYNAKLNFATPLVYVKFVNRVLQEFSEQKLQELETLLSKTSLELTPKSR